MANIEDHCFSAINVLVIVYLLAVLKPFFGDNGNCCCSVYTINSCKWNNSKCVGDCNGFNGVCNACCFTIARANILVLELVIAVVTLLALLY